MLHVFAMKCCLKCLAICLITIIVARFHHPCACLTCSSVHTCLISSSVHPLLAHQHLCCVDVYWCLVLFFLFLLCYISLCLHFGLFVYIFSLSFLFLFLFLRSICLVKPSPTQLHWLVATDFCTLRLPVKGGAQ